MVAPEDSVNVQVVAGSQNTNTSADGVTIEYLSVRDAQVATGRFITVQDVVNQTQVAVLGATVLTTLYPSGQDPVGSTITLGGIPFQVVGTMVSKGGGGGRNQDDTIYIPLTTAEYVLPHTAGTPGAVSLINIEATRSDTTTQASNEVEAYLRALHHIPATGSDDFSFFNQTSIQQTASNVSGTLTTLLAGVAACALLVSGIGIMNIMLVTVTERTREIGLRMAVGASRHEILVQFLTEAVLVSLSGGILGILVGVSIPLSVQLFVGNVKIPISTTAIVVAFGVSVAVGLVFGMLPANRASHLNPTEALRYE
jgi:putative ABC transport system permease protein